MCGLVSSDASEVLSETLRPRLSSDPTPPTSPLDLLHTHDYLFVLSIDGQKNHA